jgi:hypothetical protein
MDQAKIAIDARWASIREDYAKARRCNLQNLRQKSMKTIGRRVRHWECDKQNDACLQSQGR